MTIKFFNPKNSYDYFLLSSVFTLFLSTPLHATQSHSLDMNQWLKARFGAQHEALIPIVAVADMLYSCQQQKQIDENLTIKAMITQLDKNKLAEKLISCLGDESPKSDTALNYGLKGCFHEQLLHLSVEEKQQKMGLVTESIAGLSRSERQKSFTQCVTDQAIHYLK
ncbi:hypothetical protein [Colwellia sp. PAMC 21821]|uniref:hypothetical protein n=1 Tax=Colwellia sp. PAMC 21821 TaxID=1816219 RepID=UPI0009BD4218|nr:hypothetical protein [Colwellia sp. PAMC 21821]ARD44153.1 hypothetical protein A3Q33_07400 [Colwellia sp. PAMC 21821]